MYVDLTYQTQMFLGLSERELHPHFERLSRGIASAVDVGANEGMYSLYFLKKTAAKRIVVFEPEVESASLLVENLALNECLEDRRLEIVPKWVGSSDSEDWTTLDHTLQSIPYPALIKVDIEGGEVELLRGSQKLLQHELYWIIEVHSAELERECLQLLERAGYTTELVGPAWWRAVVPELRPRGHNRWLVAWPGARADIASGA